MKRDKKNQHVIVVADPDDEDDPELKIEEEDELGTRRTKTSKKSKFQSVAPKAPVCKNSPADRVGAPVNEPLAHQEGEQVEDSGYEFQTPTNERLADVEDDHVEEPDPKRARTE
ncbi:unnamed protein product [Fusarium graminearum]|nr:unnamed protein product [Fusarium graminearum]